MTIPIILGLTAGLLNVSFGWIVLSIAMLAAITFAQLHQRHSLRGFGTFEGTDGSQLRLLQSLLSSLVPNGGAVLITYFAGLVLSSAV